MTYEFRLAMVAGTYDPVTDGHIDIVRRAKERSEKVLVLVAENPLKKPLFTLAERVDFMQRAIEIARIPDIEVIGSDRLLVDVYMQEDCDVRLVGVRNEADIAYEESLNGWNAYLYPAFKWEKMDAKKELEQVSSSAIKQMVALDGDVSPFVEMFVKAALEERMRGHFKIGITGGISVGKSWVAKALVSRLQSLGQLNARDLTATLINVDELIRQVYAENRRGGQRVRNRLAEIFGDEILTPDRLDVDRTLLSARLFTDDCPQGTRDEVAALTKPHVERLYRERLAKTPKGIVLVEWAQMAEMRMSHWTNNNVIIVDSPDREAFAAKRGIDPARLAEWSKYQMTAEQKLAAIVERIAEEGGHAWIFKHGLHTNDVTVDQIAQSIVRGFPALSSHAR